MASLRFETARECVVDRVTALAYSTSIENISLHQCRGRVLARNVLTDRNYPPVARSIRDGFAVRAGDLPGQVRLVGEVRAGSFYNGSVQPGEAVEIMTGAPVPAGSDAVVMVEHVQRDGEWIRIDRPAAPGDFINPKGAERRVDEVIIESGTRLDYAHISALATVGVTEVPVYCKPKVAILATGDEVVPVEQRPEDHQVRNSNAYSLSAQVERAGGVPEILPIARDDREHTLSLVQEGLERSDLLLLSGGVSAGKYDIVEPVLASLSAQFHFDRVLIQPGQPVVFGTVADRVFFGLPGNPVSTMVTFEILARAALELIGGLRELCLPFTLARLTQDFRHRPGLTRFLPARLAASGVDVTPLKWQGSSDVFAQAAANAYLVVDDDRESWKAGDLIRILLR